MDALIRKDGGDLVLEVTAVNSINVGVAANIFCTIEKRNGVNLYYNPETFNFDLVSEPLVDLPVDHVRNGLHERVIPNAAEIPERSFRVHILITGSGELNQDAVYSTVVPASANGSPVTLDDSTTNHAIIQKVWDALRTNHIINGSFGQYIPSNVTRWNGLTSIDGKGLTLWSEILLAATTGRFKINTPTNGNITFYRQNNTTPLYIMNVSNIERTRIS